MANIKSEQLRIIILEQANSDIKGMLAEPNNMSAKITGVSALITLREICKQTPHLKPLYKVIASRLRAYNDARMESFIVISKSEAGL
ncbi:MAG: hypothetical protein HUJ30_01940 [Gammaproteobacteria bacterium]|nr:hypothetical protein [Gammaproteobacteria bacterium]